MKYHLPPRLAWASFTLLLNLALTCRGELREEFHQTYPLAKDGTIQLGNVNGNVRISGWERDEVQVDAVKRAKTQEHLDQVKIDIDAKSGAVRIKTKYPDGQKGKNNSASVDYTLKVPRAARLDKVSTVNGSIEIQQVSGDVVANSVNGTVAASRPSGAVELSTVNGTVKASLAAVSQEIKLKSVNGGVTVSLPPGVNAQLAADTLNGGISCDFPLEAQKHFPVGRKLQGKLGEGGPEIKLSSVNGGIHIERAAAGQAERE